MIQSLWYIFLVCALTSCASVPSMTAENQDREALISRIHIYWDAKQKDDFQTMTGLMDKDTVSADTLNAQTRFSKYSSLSRISEIRIDSIDMIDKEKAKVVISIQVDLLIGNRADNNKVEQVVTDTWVKKKGLWFMSLNKPSLEDIFQKYQNKKETAPS